MNISGYAKTEQRTFDVHPLSPVDCICFCWLAFYDYSLLSKSLPLSLEEIAKEEAFNTKKPYRDSFSPLKSMRLLRRMADSARFKNVLLLDYKRELNKAKNVQFCAISLKIDDQIVIAFGGTDPSFVGWKEDFMLAYKDDIASYPLAIEFLRNTIETTEGDITIAGYSKGGNVATNTVLINDHERIVKVYSFDGPGFRDEVLEERRNEQSLAKVTKFIPESSLVGIIFTNEKEAIFIRSNLPPVMQHDPFSWPIKDGDFIRVNKRTMSSTYLQRAFNGWVDSLALEEREKFTEIAFGTLGGLKTKDLMSFGKTFLLQVPPMIKAYRHLSKADRQFFNSVISRLCKNFLKPKKD